MTQVSTHMETSSSPRGAFSSAMVLLWTACAGATFASQVKVQAAPESPESLFMCYSIQERCAHVWSRIILNQSSCFSFYICVLKQNCEEVLVREWDCSFSEHYPLQSPLRCVTEIVLKRKPAYKDRASVEISPRDTPHLHLHPLPWLRFFFQPKAQCQSVWHLKITFLHLCQPSLYHVQFKNTLISSFESPIQPDLANPDEGSEAWSGPRGCSLTTPSNPHDFRVT